MAKTEAPTANIPDDLIQLVSAEIAIGENQETVVKRAARNPLTYPEVLVLEKLHLQPGKPEAVRKVKHLGYIKRSVSQEKRRLMSRYGAKVVEEVYPGRSPAMERYAPVKEEAPAPGKRCRIGDFAKSKVEPDPVSPDPAPEPAVAAKGE